MSVQVKNRRDINSVVSTFVGAQSELIINTTTNRIHLQDGTTPGGVPVAKLSDVTSSTVVSIADSNYTALTVDRNISYTSLSSSRTVTLPSASLFPVGTVLSIYDTIGGCSSSILLNIIRSGSDLINGVTGISLSTPYSFIDLISDGTSRWNVVGGSNTSKLQQISYGDNGANIQFGVLETLVPLSGASSTALQNIPANCIVFSVGCRTISTVTGAPSYGVGVSGNTTQFGGGLNVAVNSTNFGLIGPTAFYSNTPLIVTPTSGSFTGGSVRLSIHYAFMNPSSN